jgi:hypothetical protein
MKERLVAAVNTGEDPWELPQKGGYQLADTVQTGARLGDHAVFFGFKAFGKQGFVIVNRVFQLGLFQVATFGKIHANQLGGH